MWICTQPSYEYGDTCKYLFVYNSTCTSKNPKTCKFAEEVEP